MHGDKHEISRQLQAILQLRPDQSRQIHKTFQEGMPVANEIESLYGPQIVPPSEEVQFSKLVGFLSGLSESSTLAINTPIFLAHSQDDKTVPFELGNDMSQVMKRLGFDVT
jgi:hypothetical protein